jgi:ligand-binding sensor protein
VQIGLAVKEKKVMKMHVDDDGDEVATVARWRRWCQRLGEEMR